MKVKLIQITDNPIDVMWTAARTCYNAGSPIDTWETRYPENIDLLDGYDNGEKEEIVNKHWNLVKKVLDSGHLSIAEHVYFTFAIEGISRACSHQLVRHRHCTFSQQSQRYVEIKEDINTLQNLRAFPVSNKQVSIDIANKYFVDANEDNCMFYIDCLYEYMKQTSAGIKAEDARQVLPNATKTNIIMTCNLAELMHICELRLCTRAQLEIRNLFKEIKNEVAKKHQYLADFLVPKCEKYGFCTEAKCCGRKPKLKDVKEMVHEYKQSKLNELTELSQESGLYEGEKE